MEPSEMGAAGGAAAAPKYRIGSLPGNTGAQDWVTLVSCANILEADLVKSQLEGAGLAVFIPDEHLMTAAAWGLNTYGYVRLQVKPTEYDAARELLCATGDAVAT